MRTLLKTCRYWAAMATALPVVYVLAVSSVLMIFLAALWMVVVGRLLGSSGSDVRTRSVQWMTANLLKDCAYFVQMPDRATNA